MDRVADSIELGQKAPDATDLPHVAAVERPIDFFLRNNRGWFRSVTIVVYAPGRKVPTVDSKTLLPLQRTRLKLPIGAKVYIATQDQIQLIKDGRDIRRFPPSLTVRPDDEGQEYPIFK